MEIRIYKKRKRRLEGEDEFWASVKKQKNIQIWRLN